MESPDLSALFRFLETLDHEVQGRESQVPPPEVCSRVTRFIEGDLAAAERAALLEELRNGPPGWIGWFAEQIKAGRAASGNPEPTPP
ncbi:MAG: hypothetical protein WC076_08780 [Terrimicrobiaceae bacterium]|nr:hypothetical protein [Terrimicrobiaceae bacterium]